MAGIKVGLGTYMKIGIIGCGLIGQKRASAGFEVIAAADSVLSRAEALTSTFGGNPFSEPDGVLDSTADAVVVAVTHDKLAEIGLKVLHAGKHLLLEKPGARSLKELTPLARVAEEKGLKIKVGYNHRFHPAVLKARELVTAGAIGDLMFVRGRYGHGGRIGYEKEWRFLPKISGGGELLDQGSHLVDLAGWFLGRFTNIYGVLERYFWDSSVEDNCFMTLKSEEGKTAHLHASWTEWKNMFSFEIYGRDGKLAIDGLGGSYGLEQLALYRMLPEMGPPETTIWQYPFPDKSWELELREFASAIAADRRPVGDVTDALETLRIIDCIYASSPFSH